MISTRVNVPEDLLMLTLQSLPALATPLPVNVCDPVPFKTIVPVPPDEVPRLLMVISPATLMVPVLMFRLFEAQSSSKLPLRVSVVPELIARVLLLVVDI